MTRDDVIVGSCDAVIGSCDLIASIEIIFYNISLFNKMLYFYYYWRTCTVYMTREFV